METNVITVCMKRNPIKTWRNKCDALLTPIMKKLFPRCLLGIDGCARVTQVAHHHVHKSKSTRLRYEIINLIPLCNHCHVVLHHDESFWGAKVAQIRGAEWFGEIERMKHETVKADVYYFKENYERLSKML